MERWSKLALITSNTFIIKTSPHTQGKRKCVKNVQIRSFSGSYFPVLVLYFPVQHASLFLLLTLNISHTFF